MKKKKFLAMLLATGMVLSSFGCGQEKKPVEVTPETTEKSGSESTVTVVEEEVVPVTWVIRNDPQEDDEQVVEAVNEILREKYHLELNLIAIPNAEYNDKMNLKITSGEDWDLCYTANFVNKFNDNVNREAFLGLNELIETTEAGKTLMSVYPEGLTDIATVSGTIYAIPNYQIMYTQIGAYIQKDLADEFGLDVESVSSIEDLEPFMEWVRDNKEGIWPICEGMSYGNACYGMEMNTLFDGLVGSNVGVGCFDETYTVVNRLEASYEAFKLLNSYYKQGFVRSDAATAVDITSDLAANRYAVIIGSVKPGGDADYTARYGKEYVMAEFGGPILGYDAGATTMTAINVNSKNPEAALKLISVVWTDPEVYNMLLFGIEGEHYNKVADNRVELIENSGYNRSGLGWALGNQFNAYLLPGQADDVWEVTEAGNKDAMKSVLTGFVPDSSGVATEVAQVSSVEQEYLNSYKYIEDYDAWYKEYMQKLEVAGINVIIEEMQKQVDAWREANGM